MLTVICGGMFSEKSTELQRRGKRLERAGKRVMYFKPDMDNRYSDNSIVTHDGKKVPCFNIPSKFPEEILALDFDGTDAILIDEVQFIDSKIFGVLEFLQYAYLGIEIIVAGLDMDFEGQPFLTTAYLMASAEEVVKLNAVCTSCGNDAWVSYKEPNGKRIELGTDEYKPLCRKCFNQKIGSGK